MSHKGHDVNGFILAQQASNFVDCGALSSSKHDELWVILDELFWWTDQKSSTFTSVRGRTTDSWVNLSAIKHDPVANQSICAADESFLSDTEACTAGPFTIAQRAASIGALETVLTPISLARAPER